MRVIAGKARRLNLKTIAGDGTRPTTDRIKETLFNMINNDMYGCTFLDLFSGSGAIGIEALSREANKAYFVENNRKAVACINENLEFTRLKDDAVVYSMDAKVALNKLEIEGVVFDYIFMDPPYDKLIEKEVLEILSKSNIINSGSTIIVEASLDTKFDYVKELGFEIVKEKLYKTNKHMFIKRIGVEND